MTSVPALLAGVLAFQSTATPSTPCADSDHRCQGLRYVQQAAEATSSGQRALYLFAASRSFLYLYDEHGHLSDLCASRGHLERALAASSSTKASVDVEDARQKLQAREAKERARGRGCASAPRPSAKQEPRLARARPAPASQPDEQPPALLGMQPRAEPPGERVSASSDGAGADPLIPVIASERRTVVPQPHEPSASDRRPGKRLPGRGLLLTGGLTLGSGLALAAGAASAGAEALALRREGVTLVAETEIADAADRARDAALRGQYGVAANLSLGLAIGGGVLVIVGAVLTAVGARRMLRAASGRVALVPAPGALMLHARF